jgi:hypothetical protein
MLVMRSRWHKVVANEHGVKAILRESGSFMKQSSIKSIISGKPNLSLFCVWVAVVIVLAPNLWGVVSLPLPPQGDSYYLKGWKHDIVEVIPANLGHGTLDFVAKSYIPTSGTMFIEARGINVNDTDGTFLWQYDTRLRSKWTQDDSGTH